MTDHLDAMKERARRRRVEDRRQRAEEKLGKPPPKTAHAQALARINDLEEGLKRVTIALQISYPKDKRQTIVSYEGVFERFGNMSISDILDNSYSLLEANLKETEGGS